MNLVRESLGWFGVSEPILLFQGTTYRSIVTQDRLCPKGKCDKTRGGCPCVRPGGDPGLPTDFQVKPDIFFICDFCLCTLVFISMLAIVLLKHNFVMHILHVHMIM